jgi:hypothetical protein
MRLPHTVCPNCGFYEGREVVEVKKEKKKAEYPGTRPPMRPDEHDPFVFHNSFALRTEMLPGVEPTHSARMRKPLRENELMKITTIYCICFSSQGSHRWRKGAAGTYPIAKRLLMKQILCAFSNCY